MIDLKAFRIANNLTQGGLGEYLGIQKSFVSQIEHGNSRLPKDKLTKLLSNDEGWDTSMLLPEETIGDNIHQNGGSNNIGKIAGDCSSELLAHQESKYSRKLPMDGRSWNTVSKLLGHTDISTTQIYAKVVDESKRKAVNLIPAI